jgi:colanic acid biosynthesis protein WcaH
MRTNQERCHTEVQPRGENFLACEEEQTSLDTRTFAAVVANTPLIAIDLIIEDAHGAVLFGLRNNTPARGVWFVPGGRVRKNETLDDAFSRIGLDEVGLHATRAQGRFIGTYEHFYSTNFMESPGVTTHYVVLAYHLRAEPHTLVLPKRQHSEYLWMLPAQAIQHPAVHPYAKAYFSGGRK